MIYIKSAVDYSLLLLILMVIFDTKTNPPPCSVPSSFEKKYPVISI
jgi:hypothetical protein